MAKLLVLTEGFGETKIKWDKKSKIPKKGQWLDSKNPELKYVKFLKISHH